MTDGEQRSALPLTWLREGGCRWFAGITLRSCFSTQMTNWWMRDCVTFAAGLWWHGSDHRIQERDLDRLWTFWALRWRSSAQIQVLAQQKFASWPAKGCL